MTQTCSYQNTNDCMPTYIMAKDQVNDKVLTTLRLQFLKTRYLYRANKDNWNILIHILFSILFCLRAKI